MNKSLLILLCILCTNVVVRAQLSSSVIYIAHVTGGGDRLSNQIISIDKESLLYVAADLKLEKPFTRKFQIQKKAFDVLYRYIDDNCDTVNRITSVSYDFFIIKLINKDDVTTCYLENKTVSRPYFEQLLKRINKPGYSKDCQLLIKDLKAIYTSLSR